MRVGNTPSTPTTSTQWFSNKSDENGNIWEVYDMRVGKTPTTSTTSTTSTQWTPTTSIINNTNDRQTKEGFILLYNLFNVIKYGDFIENNYSTIIEYLQNINNVINNISIINKELLNVNYKNNSEHPDKIVADFNIQIINNLLNSIELVKTKLNVNQQDYINNFYYLKQILTQQMLINVFNKIDIYKLYNSNNSTNFSIQLLLSFFNNIPNHIYFNLIDLVDIEIIKLLLINNLELNNLIYVPKKLVVSSIVFLEYILYLLLSLINNDKVVTKILLQLHILKTNELKDFSLRSSFNIYRKNEDIIKEINTIISTSDSDYINLISLIPPLINI